MFGPAFFIVGALAFLCVHSSSALTVDQANSVCALLPYGENIANPDVCTQFYECTKEKAKLNSCLAGNYYSKEYQGCVPPNQSDCGSAVTDPCAFMADGYFAKVSNSCRDFYYCKGGKGEKSSCPSGQNFDEATQYCKYASDFPCAEDTGTGNINICAVVRSGIFFGSSKSCSDWQKCQLNGPIIIGQCPNSLMFDVDTKDCDYKQNVDCRQSSGSDVPDVPGLEGKPCETNNEVRPDTTCSGYYVCVNGNFAFGKCINGQYFNTETNQCASRLDAINVGCDRCEGAKLEYVNKQGDGCTGYDVCHNGKKSSSGECPTGNYFNEIAQGCIRGDDPDFPVCQIPEEKPATPEPSTAPPTEETDPTPKPDSSTTTDPTPKTDPPATTDPTQKTDPPITTESDKKTTTPAKSTEEATTKPTEEATTKPTEGSTTKPEDPESEKNTEASKTEDSVTKPEEPKTEDKESSLEDKKEDSKTNPKQPESEKEEEEE